MKFIDNLLTDRFDRIASIRESFCRQRAAKKAEYRAVLTVSGDVPPQSYVIVVPEGERENPQLFLRLKCDAIRLSMRNVHLNVVATWLWMNEATTV
jgi:hypothetical protein